MQTQNNEYAINMVHAIAEKKQKIRPLTLFEEAKSK